jgi:hypothetical protein
MTRTRARSMMTAPRDATIVLVRHGPEQLWVEAFWSAGLQGWISTDGDRSVLRVLHNVTAWRPTL